MDLPREVAWDDSVSKRINDAVAAEVGRVRVCQKVFPTLVLGDAALDVPVDTVDLANFRVTEGVTRQFVEIFFEFSLSTAQAKNEPKSMICQTLSRMAAKTIALQEDAIILRGQNAPLLPGVSVEAQASAGTGLLGAAAAIADDNDPTRGSAPIPVNPLDPQTPGVYGGAVFVAVTTGIAKLIRKGQAPAFALLLPTRVYADTFAPPGNQSLVTTADRIRPLVEGGFYGIGTLPEDRGLLVALGGEPTVIYIGREAETEYVRQQGSRYFFRVTERVQFVARDPRALVLLNFN